MDQKDHTDELQFQSNHIFQLPNSQNSAIQLAKKDNIIQQENEDSQMKSPVQLSYKPNPSQQSRLQQLFKFHQQSDFQINLQAIKSIKTTQLTQEEINAGIHVIHGNFHEYYTEQEIIGQGSSSIVRKVVSVANGLTYAAKVIKKIDEESILVHKSEFLNLKQLKNQSIIQVFEQYLDFESGQIITIMEYIDGIELFQGIKHLAPNGYFENCARKIFLKILLGIKYLHGNGICHRDLKPNNILTYTDKLTNEDQIKITDFGISKFCQNFQKHGNCFQKNQVKMMTNTGTIEYKAPEMFSSELFYTEAINMWSAGIILYTMFCGETPFSNYKLSDLINSIQNQEVSFQQEQWKDISVSAIIFIKRLLQKDPCYRIDVIQALLDPWILSSQKAHQNIIQNKLTFNYSQSHDTLNEQSFNKLSNDFQSMPFCEDLEIIQQNQKSGYEEADDDQNEINLIAHDFKLAK